MGVVLVVDCRWNFVVICLLFGIKKYRFDVSEPTEWITSTNSFHGEYNEGNAGTHIYDVDEDQIEHDEEEQIAKWNIETDNLTVLRTLSYNTSGETEESVSVKAQNITPQTSALEMNEMVPTKAVHGDENYLEYS